MTNVPTKFTIRGILENAVSDSNSKHTETWIDLDELCKRILKDLQSNTFFVMEENDVVDHINNFFEMLGQVKIVIFDTNRLRVDIFPLFVTRAARVWWLSEKDDKITSWGILVGRFFYKYFPLSQNGKCYIKNHYSKGGSSYCEFMAWIDSKHGDGRIDQLTKSALGHAWIYKWEIDKSKKDIASSDEEWKESGYDNPPNTIGDSLL
nr:hypothetical protein [Tanacetum cinerariifolium]GEW00223.1 hypothetical protein [Tanacetum cinerariifolium]